jgi:hypothetical protein
MSSVETHCASSEVPSASFEWAIAALVAAWGSHVGEYSPSRAILLVMQDA